MELKGINILGIKPTPTLLTQATASPVQVAVDTLREICADRGGFPIEVRGGKLRNPHPQRPAGIDDNAWTAQKEEYQQLVAPLLNKAMLGRVGDGKFFVELNSFGFLRRIVGVGHK